MFFSKSSRQPGLQKPTLNPLYVVNESFDIGLPDRGQYLLIAFSMVYSDLCTSSSISIINSGTAKPFTSNQVPVGNPFL